MYHRLVAGSLLLAAVAVLTAQDTPPKGEKQPNYYPLQVGHTWEYEMQVAGMTKTFITKLSKSEKAGGKELFLLEAEIDGAAVPITEHVSASADGVFRHKFNGLELSTPLPLVKYPYKAGDSWTTKTKVGPEEVEIKATAGEIKEIEVPAGKYKAASVTLEVEQNGMKVVTTYWYAPDVGVISQEMKIGNVEFSTKLKKFTPAKAEKK